MTNGKEKMFNFLTYSYELKIFVENGMVSCLKFRSILGSPEHIIMRDGLILDFNWRYENYITKILYGEGRELKNLQEFRDFLLFIKDTDEECFNIGKKHLDKFHQRFLKLAQASTLE